MRRAQRSFFGQFVSVAACPTCAGEGTVVSSPCKKCRGDGRVRVERPMRADPGGRRDGPVHDLRAQGNVGSRGAGRGDIIVIFQVADDARFERDGEDLYTEVLVSYTQLVFGAELQVPAVGGTSGEPSCRGRHAERHSLRRAGPWIAAGQRVRAPATCTSAIQLWTPDEMTADAKRRCSSNWRPSKRSRRRPAPEGSGAR